MIILPVKTKVKILCSSYNNLKKRPSERFIRLAVIVLVGSSIERYQAVVEAANQLLNENQNYEFSHKKSINHKDVRMALIQSYYYLGNFKEAAKQMDILDPSNAPHSTDAKLLLAAIQSLSGSL